MPRKKLDTLTEQMYYVLLGLNQPGHGYAVMERIRQLSHGRVEVGPGTLYTLLGRFEKEKLIQRVEEQETRKVYCLTEEGRTILEHEYERLCRQAEDGREILGRKS